MKRLFYLVALLLLLLSFQSCGTTTKIKRIETKTFHLKQSREDKKLEKTNKHKYKNSQHGKRKSRFKR